MPVCVSQISSESKHRDKIPTIWKMKNWRKSAGLCNNFDGYEVYICISYIFIFSDISGNVFLSIQPDMLNCKPNLK